MNSIIKDNNNYKLENPKDIETMDYNTKQQLIKDIKSFTGYTYGYVTSQGAIIPVKTHNELRHNLSIGSACGCNTLLVIQ